MAVTKIWDVKGWLGKVVIYIENPAKTENPTFYEKVGMTETQAQGLTDVIEYAVNVEKTEKQYYVSAVNCSTLTARSEMMAVKKRFGKEDGIVAFHGYQSFAEGEVTPDMAHEIGVRLAEELWGERFQVLVATHLDKDRTLPAIQGRGKQKKHYQVRVQKGKAKKIGGLRGLYYRYCFELGIFSRQKHSPAKTHFLLREDLTKLEQITKEIRLLGTYHIDTESELFSFREKREQEIGQLSERRSRLKRTLRTKAGQEKPEELKGEIAGLSKEIGRLRKEVVLCDGIAERSGVMREKLQAVQRERQKGKEGTAHEYRRRSGRADGADEPQWG